MDLSSGMSMGSMVTSAMAPYQQYRSSILQQHDAQGFNYNMMREQQGYNSNMFKSRYQMTVEDLKRAGLNPMLAYQQGGGSPPTSSAPQSPIGHGASFDTDPFGRSMTTRVASAQEANINADTLKKASETKNTEADTLYKLGLPEYLSAQILNTRNSAENTAALTNKIRYEIDHVTEQIKTLTTQQEKNKSDVKLNQSLIEANKYLNMLRTAEVALTNTRNTQETLHNLILDPKARVAQTKAGKRAAEAEKQSEINKSFDSPPLPSIFNLFSGGGK